MSHHQCPVCDAAMEPDGSRWSDFSQRTFSFARCPACGFGRVVDPRTDYADLYDEAYYRGRGADPLIDYVTEFTLRPAGRESEYRALVAEVRRIAANLRTPAQRLLDFGAGLGGFVRVARECGIDAIGHDAGFALSWMCENGVPCLDESELAGTEAEFDVVVSFDVFEHIADPRAALQTIRRAVRPGGFLVMLTGDFSRARVSLARWRYASVPEIHVSFFTPVAWASLLRRQDMEVIVGAYTAPTALVHHRLRKNLPHAARLVPERLVGPRFMYQAIDRRTGLSSFPVARRPQGAR